MAGPAEALFSSMFMNASGDFPGAERRIKYVSAYNNCNNLIVITIINIDAVWQVSSTRNKILTKTPYSKQAEVEVTVYRVWLLHFESICMDDKWQYIDLGLLLLWKRRRVPKRLQMRGM